LEGLKALALVDASLAAGLCRRAEFQAIVQGAQSVERIIQRLIFFNRVRTSCK
jgi:hypothetical protein